MKAKKTIKWGCGIAAVILAALLLLIGSFIYVTRCRITDIDAATAPDGTYEIVFQTVGEPVWPFGYSHARIVLKRNGETVTKYKFDVANDGGVLYPENWSIRWEENCVKVMISGEEQPDAFYTYYFDGTVRHESPAVREHENRGLESPEMMFDEPMTDFSDLVAENEKGESVFTISIENFIDCYNSVYLQTHETGYLNSTNSENWYCSDELSPCFGYESVRYMFSADKTVWPMPTISVYAPDNDEIDEIRMVFDDHGFQDQFHELFRELCICMEKMMMPELSMAEAEMMFETLYDQSDDNFFGDHSAFDDPQRPVLNAVYQYKNIGMYCFYGSGNIEICFVPLTAHSGAFLEETGYHGWIGRILIEIGIWFGERKSMKLKSVLIVVKDIERSKQFYHDLFGLEMIRDNDGNMVLTGGLVLQEEKYWKEFLGRDIIPENNSSELYFEERDIEGFAERLARDYPDVKYVNRLMTHSWGQKVIRFYDPDGNLIEVGTPA